MIHLNLGLTFQTKLLESVTSILHQRLANLLLIFNHFSSVFEKLQKIAKNLGQSVLKNIEKWL